MSEDIEKAARDAVDAASNSERLELIAALLKAQQITQQVQRPAPQQPAPQQSGGGAAKWIGIGIGGSIFLLTVAISAVAVAISAVSVAILALVLRGIWRDWRKS